MKNRLINKLLSERGEYCQVCGKQFDRPAQVSHIKPISAGGTTDESNLLLICAKCNMSHANRHFTEIEFNNYLASLLEKSTDFNKVKLEERLSQNTPFRADITTCSKDGKRWLIECKNSSSFTPSRMYQAVAQIEAYRSITNFDKYVLAFPGLLSPEQESSLRAHKIEPWDSRTLAIKFKSEIATTYHPVFHSLFTSVTDESTQTPEEVFLTRLKECSKGKASWSEYQKLSGQILEHLFCPPLETPISELADHDGINRRDWIIPNYSDQGFWRFIREKYHADYIVVDAKNYSKPISKSQALQLANYLKPHGAGMFAIIITRQGANKGALLTIREQWMANKKMILVLNDDDIEAMLRAKLAGGEPEKVIGQAIEQFRLSM